MTANRLLRDLREVARELLQARSFTLVAVLTLALGTGANAAIFSAFYAAVLRPLPYPDGDRLVALWSIDRRQELEQLEVAPLDFLDWREQSDVFEHLGGLMYWGFNLTGEGEPEAVAAAAMSPGTLAALGVSPLHGRTFAAEEETPGRDDVVVLSHGFWQSRFGGSPGVVGRSVTLDDKPFTIVGVMPPEFRFPHPDIEMWTPLALDRQKVGRRRPVLQVFGRLRSGVTLEQARQSLDVLALRLQQAYPETNAGRGIRLVPLREQVAGKLRPALVLLLGAALAVLAIACIDLAGLAIARALRQEWENGLRVALGATPADLVRRTLLTSLLLALLGGACGLLAALAALRAFAGLGLAELPQLQGLAIDLPTLAFTAGLSVACGLAWGLLPALRVARVAPRQVLAVAAPSGRRQSRLGRVLGTLELALASALLITTGWIALRFVEIHRVSPGFSPQGRLVLQLFLPEARYPAPPQRLQFFEELLDEMRRLPGVRSAAATNALPLSLTASDPAVAVAAEERAGRPGEPELRAEVRVVTLDYFATLGIPLLRGRPFGPGDRWDVPPVAILNETLARQLWPGGDPVGRTIVVTRLSDPEELTVVGVVGDVRHNGLDAPPPAEIYTPFRQRPSRAMAVVASTGGDPAALLPEARRALRRLDPAQPLYQAVTLEELVAGSLARRRLYLVLLGAFTGLALLLAAMGIYGVISQWTAQRAREIGIRLALGAARRDVLWTVLREGLPMVAVGLGLGLAGALALARLLAGFVPELAVDPTSGARGWAVLTALAVLALVALLSTLLPALRALRIDPASSLRKVATPFTDSPIEPMVR